MEKKLRFIHVAACSNLGTRVQLTFSEETDDLRCLISIVLKKLSDFNTETEYYNIEHIDSIFRLHDISE